MVYHQKKIKILQWMPNNKKVSFIWKMYKNMILKALSQRERERVVLCGWKVCLNSNKGFGQLKTATRAY